MAFVFIFNKAAAGSEFDQNSSMEKEGLTLPTGVFIWEKIILAPNSFFSTQRKKICGLRIFFPAERKAPGVI